MVYWLKSNHSTAKHLVVCSTSNGFGSDSLGLQNAESCFQHTLLGLGSPVSPNLRAFRSPEAQRGVLTLSTRFFPGASDIARWILLGSHWPYVSRDMNTWTSHVPHVRWSFWFHTQDRKKIRYIYISIAVGVFLRAATPVPSSSNCNTAPPDLIILIYRRLPQVKGLFDKQTSNRVITLYLVFKASTSTEHTHTPHTHTHAPSRTH